MMDQVNSQLEKLNQITKEKLIEVLGDTNYMHYISLTGGHDRVEYLFNALLGILKITDENKKEYPELISVLNAIITIISSNTTDPAMTYDVFEYVLKLDKLCDTITKDKKIQDSIAVILFEILNRV